MANFDMAAANALLKELYYGQTPPNLVYMDRPFLAMVSKMEDAEGEYIPIPLRWADSQGRSSIFQTAQANQTALKASKFLLTLRSDYSLGTIANQTLMAMKSDKGSFVRGTQTVVDSAMNVAANSLSSAVFRSGTGSVSSFVGNTQITAGVITLADPNDIVQFGVGMTLQVSATDGGTPLAALGYVISRSVQNGTITVSATGQGGLAGTPSGWNASNTFFLLVQGDSNAKVSGLQAWLPLADPLTGDNFYGVDRSVDPARLAGQRPQGTASELISEAITDAATLTAREGGSPKHCILPFSSWSALEKELGAKVQYVDVKGPAEVMFRGIKFNGPRGMIDVFPDKDCPSKTAFLIQMDTFKLYSLGPSPQILTYLDSNEFLRVNNQDAAELRVGYYANLGCDAPGFNAVFPLAA